MTNGKRIRPSSSSSATQRSEPKGKRTFSLSREALTYLDSLAEAYRSTSEALDALIREKREEAQKQRISASIRGYYDSISDEERAENRAWGEFVHSKLIKD
jgi:hypothetical protein